MTRLLQALGNFFTLEPDVDSAMKAFLQAEYKKDWRAAYVTWKEEGRLPNFIRRTL
jgi:hypothetical protein|tara:strand:- start:352 stop:519 length:168 start_codon:yes stop_codon:yes gene_type:complete